MSTIGSSSSSTSPSVGGSTIEVNLLAYHNSIDPEPPAILATPTSSHKVNHPNPLTFHPTSDGSIPSDPLSDENPRVGSRSTKSTVGRFEVVDQEGSPSGQTPNGSGVLAANPQSPVPFPSPISEQNISPSQLSQSILTEVESTRHRLTSITEESRSLEPSPIRPNNLPNKPPIAATDESSDSSSDDDDSSTGSTRSPSPLPPAALAIVQSPSLSQSPTTPTDGLMPLRTTKSGRFSVVDLQDDGTMMTPGLNQASSSPPAPFPRRAIFDTLSALASQTRDVVEENEALRREIVTLVSNVFLLRSRIEQALQGQLAVDVAQDTLQRTELTPELVAIMTRMTIEAQQQQQQQQQQVPVLAPITSTLPVYPSSTPTPSRSLHPSIAQQQQQPSHHPPPRLNINTTPSPVIVTKFFADQENTANGVQVDGYIPTSVSSTTNTSSHHSHSNHGKRSHHHHHGHGHGHGHHHHSRGSKHPPVVQTGSQSSSPSNSSITSSTNPRHSPTSRTTHGHGHGHNHFVRKQSHSHSLHPSNQPSPTPSPVSSVVHSPSSENLQKMSNGSTMDPSSKAPPTPPKRKTNPNTAPTVSQQQPQHQAHVTRQPSHTGTNTSSALKSSSHLHTQSQTPTMGLKPPTTTHTNKPTSAPTKSSATDLLDALATKCIENI